MVDEALIRQLAPQGLEPRGEPIIGWGWTDWPVRDARGRDLLVRVVGGISRSDLGRALRGEAATTIRDSGLAEGVVTGVAGTFDGGAYEVIDPPGVSLAEEAIRLCDDREAWLGRFASAAERVAGLHAAGVVHGALRAETLFAGAAGVVALGPLAPLAVLEGLPSGPPEAAGTVAPEVRAGAGATAASDVWALAQAFLACAPHGAGDLVRSAVDDDPSARPDAASLARTLTQASQPMVADGDVQFTVMRPRALAPGKWHDLLAFAHKTDPVLDEDGRELDPLAEVRRQAAEVLGPEAPSYRTVAQTSAQSVVRGTELRFVPSVPGAEFNPPEVAFRWQEPVHRSAFRVRAGAAADGVVLEGRMAVFCGIVALAEIPLRLAVDATAAARRPEPEPVTARPYERIFPSYSHLDADVVTEVEAVSIYLRNQFMRDCRMLRSGEVWSARLRQAIDEATVFQLFWSRNAMASQHVRDEWEYALSLGRDDFIRPVYWEWPIPRDDARGLPPPALERLHFHPLRQPQPPPAAAPAAARRRRWLRRSVGGGAAALAACALVLGVVLGPLGGSGDRPSPSGVPAEIAAFLAARVIDTCTPMPAITAREEGALKGTSCSPAGLDATLFEFASPAAAEGYLARLEARLEAVGGREVDCGSAPAAPGRQRCFVTPDGDRYALYAGAGRPIAGVVRGPANSPAWRLRVPSPVPPP